MTPSTSDRRGAALLCTRAEITVFITGYPGSVIVPQYISSKITAFVWGKNTILKFVGNRSMKLTLQLVVVVVNVQMKFGDNLLKFTLQTQYNTQGKRHEMASRPPCSLSNTTLHTKFEFQR